MLLNFWYANRILLDSHWQGMISGMEVKLSAAALKIFRDEFAGSHSADALNEL